MKKLFAILTILAAALLISSCQKELPDAVKNVDVGQANQTLPKDETPPKGNLEGTWRGNLRISSYYNGRTYNSTYTEITFLKDPVVYSSGNGYWVDYYSDAPWNYIANHIEWTVDHDFIKILFREEGTSMSIYNFYQNDDRFYGTLNDGGRQIDFELVKTSSPNWSTYNYWGYDDWL